MPIAGWLRDVQVGAYYPITSTFITPFSLDTPGITSNPILSLGHKGRTYNFSPGRYAGIAQLPGPPYSSQVYVKFKAYSSLVPGPNSVGWSVAGGPETVYVYLLIPNANSTSEHSLVSVTLDPNITDYTLIFPNGVPWVGEHQAFVAFSHEKSSNNPLYQDLYSPNNLSSGILGDGLDFTNTANFPFNIAVDPQRVPPGYAGWLRDVKVRTVKTDINQNRTYSDWYVLDQSLPTNPQSNTHNSITYSFDSGRTTPIIPLDAAGYSLIGLEFSANCYEKNFNPGPNGVGWDSFSTPIENLGMDLVIPEFNNSGAFYSLSTNTSPFTVNYTFLVGSILDGSFTNNPSNWNRTHDFFLAVYHTAAFNNPLYQGLAESFNTESGILGVDYTQTVNFPFTLNIINFNAISCDQDWGGVLVGDSYVYTPGSTLAVTAPGLLGNDTILFVSNTSCAATVTTRVVTGPQNGILNLSPDGSFTYTPNTGFSGPDSFTYGISLSGTPFAGGGTAQVNLTAATLPPCAGLWNGSLQTDTYTYQAGQSLAVPAPGVLLNDSLSYTGRSDCITSTTVRLTTPAQFGTVNLSPDGAFAYTPGPGFLGNDFFEYGISAEGSEVTGAGSARVNLTAIPSPPVCPDLWSGNLAQDTYTYQAGTSLNVSAPGVLGNDTISFGGNSTCAASAVVALRTPAQNGVVALSPDGSFTYTPNSGYTGNDTFSYGVSVNNTTILSATPAQVTLTSFSPQLPVIRNDSYTVLGDVVSRVGYPDSGTGLTLGVLANDDPGTTGDPGSDAPLTAILLSPPGPSFASMSLNPDGSFTFTPVNGYSGTLTWTYRASNNAGSGEATVTMTVVSPPPPPPPPITPPVLVTDVYTAAKNKTLNVSTALGFLANDTPGSVYPTLVASIVPGKGPINGHLNASQDGSFIYLPSTNFVGTDTFAYQVPSGDGETYIEGKVLITVQESPPSSPPTSPPVSPISTDPVVVTIDNLSNPVEQSRPSLGYDLVVTPTVLNVFADAKTGVYSGDVEVSLKVSPARNILHGQNLQEIVSLKAVSTGSVLFLPKNSSPAVTPDIEMVASPNLFIRPTGVFQYLTSKITLINNSYKSQDLVLVATCDWSNAVPIFDNSSVTLLPGEIREVVLSIQLLGLEELDPWSIELQAVDLHGIQKAREFIKLNVSGSNPAVDDFYISTAPTGTLAFTINDPVSLTLESANTPSGDVRWYSTADTILAAYNLFLTDSGVLQSSGVRGPATQFLATIVCVVEDQSSRSYAAKAFQVQIS